MKKKINTQLIGIAILAILATAIGLTLVYFNLLDRQIKVDLKINADILRDVHYFETDAPLDTIHLSDELDPLRITLIAEDGTVLYDNDSNIEKMENHKDRPEIQSALKNGTGESVRTSETMNMNTYYYAVLLENGTILRVATQARSIQYIFLTTMPLVLLILLLIILICVLVSHIFTRQIISPIENMAKHIEDSNITPPYKELLPFTEIIRTQHADILSSAKMRQDFTANVSHELKTPLTAISGYAELMENHMVSEEDSTHFIQQIQKQAQRLLSLINDIIQLSELDRNEHQFQFEEVNLTQLMTDCVDELQVTAKKRMITLHCSGDTCMVHGNKEMLREVIDNLVQNAILYTNPGGMVAVSVGQSKGSTVLTVKDNGIGISKEEQEHIFERFYRVDKSRSRQTGGTGLGLAIVKHIAEIHDAKIMVDSIVDEGTIMKIVF